MYQPFFSIIVPVYNVEKYLLRFLDSVAVQLFTDYEVLLVDDGSPDNSGALCDDYCLTHHQFRTIHKQNGGVSSARNRGIEEAKGEWLLFFDSDDVVSYNALERIHAAIEENPAVDTIIYAIEEVMTNGIKHARLLPIEAPAYYDKEKLRIDILPYFCKSSSFLNSPYSKAFKKSIIVDSNLRFQKRVRGEDWLFVLEYFRQIHSAVAIPDILYSYMRNEDSAMSRYVPEQFQLWSENWEYKLAIARDFQLTIDKSLMQREMMQKLYYFIIVVKQHESVVSQKQKIYDILHSTQYKEWISAHPMNLREWVAKLRLLWWHFTINP